MDAQVTAWGIEHKTEDLEPGEWEKLIAALGAGTLTPAGIATRVWRSNANLYCVEVRCPETGWMVPLVANWLVAEKQKCIGIMVPLPVEKCYRIDIKTGATPEEMKAAKLGTIRKGLVIHPDLEEQGLDPASIESIRAAGRGQNAALHHANGLRLWENDDLVPRPDDVFQERLYCVRWVESRIDKKTGNTRTIRHYRGVTVHDLALILWASGLRVTAAWCIATETESGLKVGNYVQGTVLLILRKQTGEDTAFLDEVYPEVEAEVKRQLDSMHELDDPHADAPDFTDTDYQLAAYAAALRVLSRAVEHAGAGRSIDPGRHGNGSRNKTALRQTG